MVIVFNTTGLLKYEQFDFLLFNVFEFEFELEKCIVMVFNTSKLLRYEKAHSLRLLVSATSVYTRFMVRSDGYILVI